MQVDVFVAKKKGRLSFDDFLELANSRDNYLRNEWAKFIEEDSRVNIICNPRSTHYIVGPPQIACGLMNHCIVESLSTKVCDLDADG